VPTYILIDSNVYSEFQTFLRNRDKQIQYAHVDSINIFYLIENILLKPRNNPLKTFEHTEDIEHWLKEQWAGLFKDLLTDRAHQKKLTSLTSQVSELKEISLTLRKYTEAIMMGVSNNESKKIISEESKRLHEIDIIEQIKRSEFYVNLKRLYKNEINIELFLSAVSESISYNDFALKLGKISDNAEMENQVCKILNSSLTARRNINAVRKLLDLPPILFEPENTDPTKGSSGLAAAP
jgi:hypothetical protein